MSLETKIILSVHVYAVLCLIFFYFALDTNFFNSRDQIFVSWLFYAFVFVSVGYAITLFVGLHALVKPKYGLTISKAEKTLNISGVAPFFMCFAGFLAYGVYILL